MARIARRSLVLFPFLLVIPGCTSNIEELAGQVLDASSGQPVSGAEVTLGGARQVTGGDGRFSFRDVPQNAEIVAKSCSHQPGQATVPEDGGTVTVELKALPVEGKVISNLTNKGLAAEVLLATSNENSPTTADEEGNFLLSLGCPGDSVSFSGKGYTEAKVEIPQSRRLDVVLNADPETTFKQVRQWVADGQYQKAYEYVHPDLTKFLTSKEFAEDWKIYVKAGYQAVSVDVKAVNILRFWVHPKCDFADFGPKRHRNVAAVRAVYHDSAPGGDTRTYTGTAHMVKTNDGKWQFFPKVECD